MEYRGSGAGGNVIVTWRYGMPSFIGLMSILASDSLKCKLFDILMSCGNRVYRCRVAYVVMNSLNFSYEIYHLIRSILFGRSVLSRMYEYSLGRSNRNENFGYEIQHLLNIRSLYI